MTGIRTGLAPPWDLRQAFLIGVLLPLVVLSAIVAVVLVDRAERSLEHRLQGEIELLSRAVAPGIGANLQAGDHDEIRYSLSSLFSIRRVYGAAVYDADGQRVVAAGLADRDLRSSRAAGDVVRTGRDDGRYRSVDGENVYSYFSPLLDHGGRINGLLQITRERREIDATLSSLRTTVWAMWVASAVAAVIATLVLYRRLVGRHVHLLLTQMRALARGDRGVTLKPERAPREFAQIARGFNAMVEAIREADQELERRQAHERELHGQLQEAERVAVLGRLTQGLAHELASPLTVIDARIRRLQRCGSDGAERLIEDVRRQARRMTGIVRQFLHYSPLAEAARQPVVLNDLLHRVAWDLEPEAIRLVLSDEGQRLHVRGDPLRLELAVSNLLRNALRHARSTVEAGVAQSPEGAVLYVQDDGHGVPEADRPHLFEPFFTRQPSGKGTGLGLAIVANVMREHRGEVRYEPQGGGSRFSLLFPRDRTEDDP